MKNLLRIFILLPFLLPSFLVTSQTTIDKSWTFEQIKGMAKKYSLQDQLKETEIKYLKNKSKKVIDDYLQKRYSFEEKEKTVKKFREKTLSVRSMKDYFLLIEKNPTIREIEIKIHGGENQYKEYFKEMVKYNYRIYRDSNGALSFFKIESPLSPEESDLGRRIDNLPTQKE